MLDGDLRKPFRFRQVYVRDHEPVHGMDRILRAEADFFARFDRLVKCLRSYAMRQNRDGEEATGAVDRSSSGIAGTNGMIHRGIAPKASSLLQLGREPETFLPMDRARKS